MLRLQPDALLCARVARGNEEAFAVLHSRYRQQVFAFVYHLLGRSGNVDDAEDLTQEIMQKAYLNASTRRSDGSFKSWLFRIARNHTFDHIRARRPAPLPLADLEGVAEPSNVISLSAEVERRAEFAWITDTMAALPDRQREALVLRELGGASVAEIASLLGTTPEGAKQLIKRARSSVNQAAREKGIRGDKVGHKLAAATPITAIAWLGAGKAGAATGATLAAGTAAGTAAAGVATGGVLAGATGSAGAMIAAGKVAATVLAVAAIGTGGVAVSQQISTGDPRPTSASRGSASRPATPPQSLVVGAPAAERAVSNKRAANERRARARKRFRERNERAHERAQERRAKARAKTKRGGAKSGRNDNAKSPAHARPDHGDANPSSGNRPAPKQQSGDAPAATKPNKPSSGPSQGRGNGRPTE